MIERARVWLRSFAGSGHARPNPFGVGTAIVGLAVGWFCATLLLGLWPHPAGRHLDTFTRDVLGLVGLWVGFVGSVLAARALYRTGSAGARDVTLRVPRPIGYLASLRGDFGIRLRPIDVPIGIVAGLFGQYVLAPVAEAPLLPFVPHLYSRLSGPALSISHGVSGPDLIALGLLVCLVGPAVEELYFRGLLLRGLLGRFARMRRAVAVVAPVVLCAVYFAIVHLEPIVLLGLFAFGLLLGWLAWWSGRLGPGYVAHVTFNAVAFVAIARVH